MVEKIINLVQIENIYNRLRKATKNFSNQLLRDTIDHLDFEIEKRKYLSHLVAKINNAVYQPQKAYMLESAKSKGINRPTVILDIEDALVYRYCIEIIQDDLIKITKMKNIRGGRKITAVRTLSGTFEYEEWFTDWREHNEAIANGLTVKKYAAVTDIASYFENINLLILKDRVRSDVQGKQQVLDLLFYSLENSKIRNAYEVNTLNGLLQEGIDCSRMLAYYFLHPHDEIMKEFCRVTGALFFRYVDDMAILVDTKAEARRSLKIMTESLRNIGLVAGIEKTSILSSKEANEMMFLKENKEISLLVDKVIAQAVKGRVHHNTVRSAERYYKRLAKVGIRQKNWIKLLKRFYSLFTYAKSDILLKEINNHLIKYPMLWSGDKATKYIKQNENSLLFNKAIKKLISYLRSDENLYPSVESNIIECLLHIDTSKLNSTNRNTIKELAKEIFFKNNYSPQSEYARSLSCLLFWKFDKNSIDSLAKHYLKSSENDVILKKYLIFVSLTVSNKKLRDSVLNKAKKEQNNSIQRLINLVDNIGNYLKNKRLKQYLKPRYLYIHKSVLKLQYADIRSEILRELISIYRP